MSKNLTYYPLPSWEERVPMKVSSMLKKGCTSSSFTQKPNHTRVKCAMKGRKKIAASANLSRSMLEISCPIERSNRVLTLNFDKITFYFTKY